MTRLPELFRLAKFRLSYWGAAQRSEIILSAGMPRSGSTWLFNAARLLLRANGEPSSGWIGDWSSLPRKPVLLLKVSEPVAGGPPLVWYPICQQFDANAQLILSAPSSAVLAVSS